MFLLGWWEQFWANTITQRSQDLTSSLDNGRVLQFQDQSSLGSPTENDSGNTNTLGYEIYKE